MTIDSGWTKIIKTNVPAAFSSTLEAGKWQNKPGTVFIDGRDQNDEGGGDQDVGAVCESAVYQYDPRGVSDRSNGGGAGIR